MNDAGLIVAAVIGALIGAGLLVWYLAAKGVLVSKGRSGERAARAEREQPRRSGQGGRRRGGDGSGFGYRRGATEPSLVPGSGTAAPRYARTGAPSFTAPPAAPISAPVAPASTPVAAVPPVAPTRAPVAPEPFAWTDSAQPAPAEPGRAPVPLSAARKRTGITAAYEPFNLGGPAGDPLDRTERAPNRTERGLDRTIIVPRPATHEWTIELPNGDLVPVPTDAILGRRPEGTGEADAVTIPDESRTLSKTHARIRLVGEQWTIEDLDSTNGVYLEQPDGRLRELSPRRPVPFEGHFTLGTLRLHLRRNDTTQGATP